MTSALDRLVALVRRDLGADEVELVEEGAERDAPSDLTEIASALGPSRGRIVARFREPPADVDARQRRLHMLVRSFHDTLADAPPPARASPATRLHVELQQLSARAHAVDALVIDADSPIVWGASEENAAEEIDEPSNVVYLPDAASRRDPHEILDPITLEAFADAPAEEDDAEVEPRSLRAIGAVRALAPAAGLHKGGHLRSAVRDHDFGYVARSFADIYVLVLVFDGPYDELCAEREIAAALPVIERLILALPPLDPGPLAGVAPVRRARRR